ncbi:MAG: bifunctional oligoribonuclease/PAP phosphatase NrnA [Planctomycetes bacterium]|nr:bifunctional oligoribonuclease/PAP phosphatase NrnA [Planctomycetota bacterium]
MNPEFLQIIENHQRFLLAGHERPDGDCLGSEIAMFHLLQALGKQATICNPDSPASSFDYFTQQTPVTSFQAERELPEFEVMLLLDCAHLSRLGRMAGAVPSDAKIAVIDHHVGSERGDGAVSFVDATASATGMLVARLYEHYGLTPSREAADALFLSIVSDTGWFRYSNTTREVFAVTSRLTELGVEPSEIYDVIHRRNHRDSVAFLADSIQRCEIDLDGRFGYVVLDRAAIDRAARIGFDLDAIMEPLRSVDGIEVVAMFKENVKGTVKLSLRSQHDVDVQEIASSFGGGGHRKAAGASLDCGLADALTSVRREVANALRATDGGG